MIGQRNSRKQQYHTIDQNNSNNNDDDDYEKRGRRPLQGTLSHYFFGFMYDDEDDEDEDDRLYSSMVEPSANIWNRLNISLCLAIATTAAAEAAPLTIVAAMGDHLLPAGDDDLSSFAPRTAAAAVLGASLGKFCNGPIIDLMGARRTFCGSSVLLALSLLLLALAPNSSMAIVACFLIEFTSTVQWPCILVTLAAHYRGSENGMYEGGIFVTSLGSRVGALIGIPAYSLILQWTHWRFVALFGGWLALLSCSITYLYSQDSPERVHEPQNPIDPLQWQKWRAESERRGSLYRAWFLVRHTLQHNVLPSVRHICGSPTFWLVAIAHSGASTVRSSERVLATYFYETNDSLSEEQSAGSAVYLSIGITLGLVCAGNAFASRAERERKYLVSRLYLVSIVACYALALFAVPAVNRLAPDLMRIFQIMAVVVAGFGIAVPLYHIPSIVGATFGCDKGIYAAYTDGVGYGLSSIVWGIVGGSLRGHHGDGVGWAYGWAAVALLLILSSILMVEFMEHYFCRPRSGGTYETIIFA